MPGSPADATPTGPRPVDPAAVSAALNPAPRQVRVTGSALPVTGAVHLVAGPAVAAGTVDAAEAVLRAAGAHQVLRGEGTGHLTVYLSTGTVGPAAAALRALDVPGPAGLPAGGYVLAGGPLPAEPAPAGSTAGAGTGRWAVVLAGTDADGTYHAVQTLRQLIRATGTARLLPGAAVRDWPAMAQRGTIEGFYGPPWSHADRLRHFDFAAANKMNMYVYAPKDDPYHRERWRDPYPADQLARLAELAARAADRHVDFVFAVSPGQTVCHSGDADFAALTAKAQALHDVGVRAFALFFDDIAAQLGCAEDVARFGADASPAAAAQAYLLNRFEAEFVATHPGTVPLLTVATRYNGTGSSVYLDRLAALVAPQVRMMWTGPQVISPTISDADLAAVHAVYRHPIVLWDNYPVNDAQPDRLHLGPVAGRGAHLADNGATGWLANPMVQAEPSTIALATIADQAWNPDAYDPRRSFQRALAAVSDPASAGPLAAFADANRPSPLEPGPAPVLAARIAAFEQGLAAGDPARAAGPLAGWAAGLSAAPAAIAGMGGIAGPLDIPIHGTAFAAGAKPWLDKAAHYGTAGSAAVASLVAEHDGDLTTAWRQRVVLDREAQAAERIAQTVAPGVAAEFLRRAQAASRLLTLAAPDPSATIMPGSDVTLRAEVRAGDVPIRSVRFLVGDTVVGTATSAPYQVVWRDVPRRLARVTIEATDAAGGAVRSAPVNLAIGQPDRALLVFGGDGNPGTGGLAPGEVDVVNRLQHLGLAVHSIPGRQATTASATGHALVVVSSTVASGDVGTKFRDVAVPLLGWEAFVYDDMGMTSSQGEIFRAATARFIAGSPLSAGLSGDVAVYRNEGRIRWGVPAPTATVAATLPDDPGRAVLFGYDTGTAMVSGTAPARRVGCYLGDEGLLAALVSAETVRVFDTAVAWALGGS